MVPANNDFTLITKIRHGGKARNIVPKASHTLFFGANGAPKFNDSNNSSIWNSSPGLMGAKGSRPSGRLSAADVERLQRRFMKLAGPDGKVAIPKFQEMVELGANPFTGG
eukprot:1160983-Pelagomonas_calceolata.AAC.11